MKFIIITIALVAAPSLAAGVQAERTLVLDSKSGAAHSQQRAGARYLERDHEGKRTGGDLSSGTNAVRKNGAVLPEKKFRLKYRDEPKCSC